jgi:Protein of unknown function (DUF726)
LLPFLSAGVAPAVIGSLFGIAGGGLTGYRVRRRWAGVQEFDFIEISGPGQGGKNKALKQGSAKKVPSLVVSLHNPLYVVIVLRRRYIGYPVHSGDAA